MKRLIILTPEITNDFRRKEDVPFGLKKIWLIDLANSKFLNDFSGQILYRIRPLQASISAIGQYRLCYNLVKCRTGIG